MRIALQVVVTVSLVQLSGCANEYSQRDDAARNMNSAAPSQGQAQSETAWLRAEVHNLQLMLAERDRRDVEVWRAYTTLVQQVSQMQANQSPTAQQKIDLPVPGSDCIPSSSSLVAQPTKNVIHAINHSHLNAQQKREIFQSMRPPRPIDNVNPWGELSD